jgi:hypothetical protein
MDYKLAQLENINSGVANELFQAELEKVLENIADPNTPPEAKRKITIDFEITPNEQRSNAEMVVTSSSKLAKYKPSKSFVQLSYDGSTVSAYVTDPKQGELMEENIVSMEGKKDDR